MNELVELSGLENTQMWGTRDREENVGTSDAHRLWNWLRAQIQPSTSVNSRVSQIRVVGTLGRGKSASLLATENIKYDTDHCGVSVTVTSEALSSLKYRFDREPYFGPRLACVLSSPLAIDDCRLHQFN